MDLRLGPLKKEVAEVTWNEKRVEFERIQSGDSKWVRIRELGGGRGSVKINF